jgi:hypothetical protein
MGAYGFSIEHILMVDIIPDPAVRKAMNEINAGNLNFSCFFFFFFYYFYFKLKFFII